MGTGTNETERFKYDFSFICMDCSWLGFKLILILDRSLSHRKWYSKIKANGKRLPCKIIQWISNDALNFISVLFFLIGCSIAVSFENCFIIFWECFFFTNFRITDSLNEILIERYVNCIWYIYGTTAMPVVAMQILNYYYGTSDNPPIRMHANFQLIFPNC